MKIIRDYKHCPNEAKGSVIALGNFDGVHNGHKSVIGKAREIASALGNSASVLTFEPHPLNIIKPNIPHFRLTSEHQKSEIIATLGIDNLFIIEFTKAFSQINARDFVKNILADWLGAAHIVTGEDFVFGAKREGNAATLTQLALEYNIGYTRVLPVAGGGEVFSSSIIRKNLAAGRLQEAKSMLGRNFIIEGIVQQGKKLGRTIGFPTINIALGEYLRPAFGVYAVKVRIEGYEKPFNGAANIGVRPTIDGSNELAEVHIFDFSEDIYRKKVQVELIEYIREEQKFSGTDELRKQIENDCTAIKDILSHK